jgi:hypothetical protein
MHRLLPFTSRRSSMKIIAVAIAVWIILALAGMFFISTIAINATPFMEQVWIWSAVATAAGALTYKLVF